MNYVATSLPVGRSCKFLSTKLLMSSSNSIKKCSPLAVSFAKLLINGAILACVLCPTMVYRNGNFEMTFNGIVFRAENHFCLRPEAPATTVNVNEVAIALDLPNGAVVDDALMKFGECRAKLMKMNKDLSACACNQHFPFVLLVIALCVSAIVQVYQILYWRWKSVHINIMSGFVWFVMSFFSTMAYFYTWVGDFWLPDAMYAQSYFQRPYTLTAALVLCYLFILLCIAEAVQFKSGKEIESKIVCQKTPAEVKLQPTGKSLEHENCQLGHESDILEIESELNDVVNDTNIDTFNAYSRYSQTDIETLIREPLPQPKLANFEIVPKKPTSSASWP